MTRQLPGRPVAASGSQTAERIRIAATDLFDRQGFVATTVREIARACGLTPGAIYNHFGSKDEILYAIADRSHEEIERAVAAAIATATGGPTERLAAAVEALVDHHLSQPEVARVADRDHVFLSGSRLEAIVERRRGLRETFIALIEAGVASAEMRLPAGGRRLATELAARSLITLSEQVSAGQAPARAVSAIQTELALQLVGARGPKAAWPGARRQAGHASRPSAR